RWRAEDFKCMPLATYGSGTRLGRKATRDVHKQITYEYALHLAGKAPTRSELSLPHYFAERPEESLEEIEDGRLHADLLDQGIVVQLVDFLQVQEAYLEEAQEEANGSAPERLRPDGRVPQRRRAAAAA